MKTHRQPIYVYKYTRIRVTSACIRVGHDFISTYIHLVADTALRNTVRTHQVYVSTARMPGSFGPKFCGRASCYIIFAIAMAGGCPVNPLVMQPASDLAEVVWSEADRAYGYQLRDGRFFLELPRRVAVPSTRPHEWLRHGQVSCPICLGFISVNDPAVQLSCQNDHLYHHECLLGYPQHQARCVLCRLDCHVSRCQGAGGPMEFEGATEYAEMKEQSLQWDGDEWSGRCEAKEGRGETKGGRGEANGGRDEAKGDRGDAKLEKV